MLTARYIVQTRHLRVIFAQCQLWNRDSHLNDVHRTPSRKINGSFVICIPYYVNFHGEYTSKMELLLIRRCLHLPGTGALPSHFFTTVDFSCERDWIINARRHDNIIILINYYFLWGCYGLYSTKQQSCAVSRDNAVS